MVGCNVTCAKVVVWSDVMRAIVTLSLLTHCVIVLQNAKYIKSNILKDNLNVYKIIEEVLRNGTNYTYLKDPKLYPTSKEVSNNENTKDIVSKCIHYNNTKGSMSIYTIINELMNCSSDVKYLNKLQLYSQYNETTWEEK